MNCYCVVGNPINHSKSPQIHTLFARQLGREIRYTRKLLERETFGDDIRRLFAEGLHGCNVTVPFKEDAVGICAELSDRAAKAQAVNTLKLCEDGKLFGDNTDGAGLVRDLTVNNGVELTGKRILIAGAGGATRGILKPLLEQQPQNITVCNRTQEKAQSLASEFNAFGNIGWADYADTAGQTFDLVINATSTSLSGTMPPIRSGCLLNNTVLYDLVYSTEPTAFLLWGEKHGCTQLFDGSGMLAEQAAESFLLWEGVRPDTEAAISFLKQP